MKMIKNVFILMLVGFVNSCAIPNSPAGGGVFYTNSSELTYYDPYIKPQQKAILCERNILGFSYGDVDLENLKLRSTIRKIATMEKTYDSVLSLFSRSCLIVKGE